MYGPVTTIEGPRRIGIPPSELMVTGETYVGIPPGHTRPAFVRKRAVDSGRPPWFLTNIFGSSRRAYVVEGSRFGKMFCRSTWRDRREYSYYPYGYQYTNRYNPEVSFARPGTIHDTPLGPVAANVNQTCGGCGRYRSAAWQARHPLAPGQSGLSPLCRRCQNKRSSSDDYEPGHHRRKRHHRRSQLYTDSTDDSYYDRQPRRRTRINHTDSRDYRRHRSSSRGSIRVVIANQNGGPRIPVRDLARSSSIDDGVRVIHREEFVDMPERRRLSRFRARTFSGDSYIEDGGRYIEDLERRTYYTPPRRVSRTRYVDEFEVPRDRSRPRSNSHVTFVDEVEEPVLVSRPRRLSRRRSMRFDGAAETESVEYEIRGRSPSTNRPILSRSRSGGVQLIEETVIPRSRSLQRAIEPDREARLIEKTTIERRTPFYRSDYDARSRSQSRSTRRPESFVEIPESDGNYSGTIRVKSRSSSQDDGSYEPHPTHQEPRRRYRADSISSDSESERPHTPIPYRYVYPPSPPPRSPSPRVDYLSEMLAKAQITPPGDQGNLRDIRYARGCASRRYEDTPPPSADYRQPAFYRGEEVDGMECGPGNYECLPRGRYGRDAYSRAEEEGHGGGYTWMD